MARSMVTGESPTCRAVCLVREHSRACHGAETKLLLLRVERRLLQLDLEYEGECWPLEVARSYTREMGTA
ncbi:hypothetical protein DEW08_10135 [Azospirillum thermophilum]|uniref:Uncharacterized protein n=1 Tax=Azospirillum thermophilum TaxID=2202148 RepID=A0A2S2CPX7_9PROT|nr:hypothetical protein DEW08_10135 [Azospirillum thermophilum]